LTFYWIDNFDFVKGKKKEGGGGEGAVEEGVGKREGWRRRCEERGLVREGPLPCATCRVGGSPPGPVRESAGTTTGRGILLAPPSCCHWGGWVVRGALSQLISTTYSLFLRPPFKAFLNWTLPT